MDPTPFDAGAQRLARQLRATADVILLGTADKLAADEKVLAEVVQSLRDAHAEIEEFDGLLGAIALSPSHG